MQFSILVYDGFDEMDALGPLDVLRTAAAAGADLDVGLVRLGSATVTSAHGLQLHVPGRLARASPPAVVVVPGAGWLSAGTSRSWADAARREVASGISGLLPAGTTIAAVSSAAIFLAAAGLLEDRAATAHHSVLHELRESGAEIVHARVVEDGAIVTSAGATAGLDLALWLVERFAGPAVAHRVEVQLEYERRGTVWRR